MRRLFFIFLLFLSTLTANLYAQIFTVVIDEFENQVKVKLIDEFFDRFNRVIDYKGDPITLSDDPDVDSIRIYKTLTGLLDLDTFADKEGNLDSISSEFINYIVLNDKKIHYTDTTWQAEAISSFKMNHKEYPIKIFLNTENVKNQIYKWTINDIHSPAFDCITDTLKSHPNIFPGAHGSSFITLPETINLNSENVQSFFYKGYQPNLLTVFAYLVMTHNVEMLPVSKVIYHFILDDYYFKVERFEREKSYNKGWLISKIEKFHTNSSQ